MVQPTIKILHLDDDPMMHLKTGSALSENNFGLSLSYDTACDMGTFFDKVATLRPDCVLLDIRMSTPDGGGIEALKQIRDNGFMGVAIMLTAVAQTETILSAVDLGANDFITKGLSEVELAYRITQSLKVLEATITKPVKFEFSGFTMQKLQNRIPKIVRSPLKSVLVWGESGTGKEVTSQLFRAHLGSDVPFIPINCGALVDELMESEFFGHKKGSFTGASANKVGVFKLAHNGWVFLDEVANLSMAGQTALLRVLESGEIRPVGGNVTETVDVRVLAATNVDLDDEVTAGRFRGDLLMRLRSYELYLPPLRERTRSEVHDLLSHLMKRLNKVAKQTKDYILTPEATKVLARYNWAKGNVREMWNTLQAASVNADGHMLRVVDLPKSVRSSCLETTELVLEEADVMEATHRAGAHVGKNPEVGYNVKIPSGAEEAFEALQGALSEDRELSGVMDLVEKAIIAATLERHPSRAAVFKALGISRSSLNQKRQKYLL